MSLHKRQFLTCGICFCTIHHKRTKTRSQQCCHYFHVKCIDPWLAGFPETRGKPTCPICRSEWDIMEVVQWNKQNSGKFTVSVYDAHELAFLVERKREKSICRVCHVNNFKDHLVVCNRCGKGCHTYCFPNPRKRIPSPTWICQRCERRIVRRRKRVNRTNQEYAERPSVVLDTITLDDGDFVVENVDVKPNIELLRLINN